MGAPHFMVGTSIHAVLAQRLVRLNCESCAEPHTPEAHDLAWLHAEFGEALAAASFKRGRGCSHCNSVGLVGRTGIYEMLEITPELTQALNRNETNQFMTLAERAMLGRSLKHQALQLAFAGRAPVSELIRVASELGD
jgi:MSHA biogenesis protein MshE